jgi:hypothetical protein
MSGSVRCPQWGHVLVAIEVPIANAVHASAGCGSDGNGLLAIVDKRLV